MNRELIHNAEQYHKRHRRKKAWHKVLGALGCVVVFCTTYALILPALTMEKELICPVQEHVHTQECYTALSQIVEQRLLCPLEELDSHSHDASCFESESICGLAETEGHAHTDGCRGEAVLHCTLEESAAHAHEPACFTGLEPVCGLAESEGHTHVETCRDESGVLICTLEELPSHSHELACFTGLEPVCGLVESEGHAHTDDCRTPGELICGLEELAPHSHTAACFDTPAVCGLEEIEGHKHSEACYETLTTPVDAAALTCTLAQDENHSHTFLCYGAWEQTCTQEEHTHIDTCYVEKTTGDEAVDRVISLIDAMPTSEEIEAQLAAYEEAEDMESYESYYKAVGQQGLIAHNAYTSLTEAQQALVSNIDRLMDSSWLWSRMTLETTATIPVHLVNDFTITDSYANRGYITLLKGKSMSEFGKSLPSRYWSTIVVEAAADGTLYVAQVLKDDTTTKNAFGPATANGFVLYIWQSDMAPAQIDVSVGDLAKVDFDYSQTGPRKANGSTATSYGNVTFHTRTSNGTSTVQGASTSDFIDLNIYDYYGTKSASAAGKKDVNTNWNSDKNWPGYQWNGGAYMTSSSFSPYRVDNIDFGNSLITDYAYGGTTSGITNGVSQNYQKVGRQGGNINEIVQDSAGNWANLPVGISHGTAVMGPNLSAAGYPWVTNAGSMVDFFSESQFASKKNSTSIDGLFQYDPVSGEYWFDSRKNHAYYNTNRFTLYNQIITPNFILYPFGNFLPFNNITDPYTVTQVTDIDRVSGSNDSTVTGYMQMIRDRMAANGLDTTEAQLYNMLGRYQNYLSAESQAGWKAEDSLNEYFRNSSEFGDSSINFGSDSKLQSILNRLYNIDFDVEKNFLFGMDMKMNFMMPKGGMTGNDNNRDGTADYPMVFYFAGDDDVWVYIDGTLFLDLSGIHRHVGGEIDFVNGVVNYYAMESYIDGAVSKTPYFSVGFEDIVDASLLQTNGTRPNDGRFTSGLGGTTAYTFKDYSSHAFNFYYMERGTGSSVCCLNFNFPLLRQNSITVSKEVAADAAIQGDPDYKFQVLKASDNGTKTDQLFIAAGTPYTLYDKDGSILQEVVLTENPDGSIAGRRVVDGSGTAIPDSAVRKTDENGVFTLKAGQRAEFPGISENLGKYYVRELISGTVLEQYDKVTVSGESTTTAGSVTVGSDTFTGMDSPVKDMSSGATAFRFTNDVDEQQLGSLSLTKELTTLPGQTVAQTFDMTVTLSGTPLATGTPYRVDGEARTVATAGIISLAPGQTAVIDGLLAGTTYTVQETAASAKGYTVTYTVDGQTLTGHDSAAGTITPHSAVAVTISNSQKGITVDLPVEKTLQDNELGSVDRDFTFRLTPIVSAEDQTPIGESLTYTLTVPARTASAVRADKAFSLTYAAVNMEQLPASFYYLLTEDAADNDPAVQYDDEAYVVCITISEDADGQLIADVTCTGSDGTTVSVPAFVNHLTYYALPETGGTGTHLYTMAGLMLLCSAAYLLYRQKRRKEAN